MKPSSGRARSAATLAATAFESPVGSARRGIARDVARSLARAVTLRFTVAVALGIVPGAAAFAQKTPTVSQGPAVRDNTPEIDASIAQKDWQASLTQLDARIATNPRDAQAKFKRATVLAHLNRDDEAITAFTELTQLYPELPEPYNNLAALYAKQGRYAEARAALETAVKASPGYGLAYENLGDLYLRMADQAYRRAQSLGAGNATTTQRIADIGKIVAPRKTPAAKQISQPAAEPDFTNRATPNIVNTPAFQFGGPNGSLAVPPYVAPSQ